MNGFLVDKRFFYIALLTFIVVFFNSPRICLADEAEDISLEDTARYLELPENKVQDLMQSLISIFHSEWESLASSGNITAEEMAVPSIMKRAVQIQTLNHILIEAPIEISFTVIKNAIKIAGIFLAGDLFDVLNELEKQSVDKAVNYGMSVLFKKEIKMSPGVIEFEYKSKEGEIERILIQYIAIYKPQNGKTGEMIVRFYSVKSLKPPKNEGIPGMTFFMYTELTNNLPPFIVDIHGIAEDYKWIGSPSIAIDFPPEVLDLGIKPISLMEKYVLKPIETTIKEVEIIITKVTGKSPKLTDIWKGMKDFILRIGSFSPAELFGFKDNKAAYSNIPNVVNPEMVQILSTKTDKNGVQNIKQETSFEEFQEIIDDLSEQIDVFDHDLQSFAVGKAAEQNFGQISDSERIALEEGKEEIVEMKNATNTEELISEQIDNQPVAICSINSLPSRNKVIINEIAWMGGVRSANDEWIELKNISGGVVNLSGWQILDKDNQIKIIFSVGRNPTTVEFLPTEILLLERTDDDSVMGIIADMIYAGNLNNNNEALYLFDENCQLQDEILATSDWLAGDNASKRTMERRYDLTWQTSLNPGGTPKAENSQGYTLNTGGGGGSNPTSPPVPQEPLPVLSSTSSPQLLITEIQIKTASSTNNDFIEIYNFSTTTADISNFQLKKRTSTGNEYSVKVFPKGSLILAKDYFLWANTEYASMAQIAADTTSSQTLSQNNSVALFDNAENILDMVAWGTSTDPFVENISFPQNPIEGQSLGRKWSTATENYIDNNDNQNDFETQSPSPGEQNQNQGSTSPPQSEELLGMVVINEIAWMGTRSVDDDEWIELYNNSSSPVDLTGWTMANPEGSFLITFPTSTIDNYFLLERQHSEDNPDGSISDITADLFYNGILRNEGEKIELRNASGTLIDLVDCSQGWFAGTTTKGYISMERINATSSVASTNWASNNLITRNGLDFGGNKINGTPRTENSVSKKGTVIPLPILLPFDEFDELTLTYLGSPYGMGNMLVVNPDKTLNIEPGVMIKFDPRWGYLEIGGTLKAIGTEDKKIIITSSDGQNTWGGINFTPLGAGSELNWTEIRRSRTNEYDGYTGILVNNTSIVLKNSLVEGYYLRGIKLINSSSTIEKTDFLGPGIPQEGTNMVGIEISGGSPTILNCGLIDGHEYGIYVQTDGAPLIEGNNFENNRYPIWVAGSIPVLKSNKSQNGSNSNNGMMFIGAISQNTIWYNNDLPYVIRSNPVSVSSGAILTIEPGTKVGLWSGVDLIIGGVLLAGQNGQEPVIFNSGYWGSIRFTNPNSKSILENVIVSHGGNPPAGYFIHGQIEVIGSMIEFRNSTSTNSSRVGIYLEDSSSTISDSYVGNNSVGIKIQGNQVIPQLSNNVFASNTKSDIFWPGGGENCTNLATGTLRVECGCCPYQY